MAVPLDQSSKEDDLKTQFITREGTYRLMNLSEYSRPNRVGYTSNQNSPQVRVSLVSLSASDTAIRSPQEDSGGIATNGHGPADLQVNQISSTTPSSSSAGMDHVSNGPGGQRLIGALNSVGDRICFNFGKELFVYPYRGMKKASDISKPIDKKLYKGTNPSCHDFNSATATHESTMLLIGFTTGQIQLVQPGKREPGKLFNEDRLIDKTKVTCLKWLPGSPNLFLAGHSSGHLYLYNEESPCVPTAPHYSVHKLGDGFSVHACKSKVARNPVQRWTFGTDNGSINEFAFSPCGSHLAIASQDGFLRVFRYESMELLGIARSYFGGFLCVCWSPDGKYIVVGGEDDLVTVWSFSERRVVARGQGHRSWVSVVAFDPFTTSYASVEEDPDVSDDDGVSMLYRNTRAAGHKSNDHLNNNSNSSGMGGEADEFYSNSHQKLPNGGGGGGMPSNSRGRRRESSFRHSVSGGTTSYRLGSVSQDTQLCLWDITEDVLRPSVKPLLRHSVNSPLQEKGTRIEVKPYAASAPGDSTVDSTPAGGGGGGGTSSTNGQTPASSLSSISSSNNNNNNNNDKMDGAKCSSGNAAPAAATAAVVAPLVAEEAGKVGGNSKPQKPTATISLIGNCVGNNLHKMTMSSSISSTSSITSQAMDEVGSSGAGAGPAASSSNSKAIGNGAKHSSDSSTHSSSGMMTLNALTQRLSHFSFSNDKTRHGDGAAASTNQNAVATSTATTTTTGKKGFTLSKPFGGHNSISKSAASSHGGGGSSGRSVDHQHHHQHQSHGGMANGCVGDERLGVTTFDPIKLMGSSACPRFDECPVLEPLICKKIAHERLTALVFREDCFLTACQDGIIYTWARPPFEQAPKMPPT